MSIHKEIMAKMLVVEYKEKLRMNDLKIGSFSREIELYTKKGLIPPIDLRLQKLEALTEAKCYCNFIQTLMQFT